jgi:hypothetical protein
MLFRRVRGNRLRLVPPGFVAPIMMRQGTTTGYSLRLQRFTESERHAAPTCGQRQQHEMEHNPRSEYIDAHHDGILHGIDKCRQ